jgi:hypothetical protein
MMIARKLGSFMLALLICQASLARAIGQEIRTVRYDLPEIDLSLVGNEVVLDYFFPPLPAQIVTTRFDLTFESESPDGFDASTIGIILQPPIDDPIASDERLLTFIQTGAYFGWSGSGTFEFTGTNDELNGSVLEAPPASAALLYGVVLFNAARLTDPNDATPLGGRFVASHIEVDYVIVPEPSLVQLSTPAALLSLLARRRRHCAA